MFSMVSYGVQAAVFDGTTCRAVVTQTSTSEDVLDIGESHIYHVTGSANAIRYNSPYFESRSFDSSVFPAGYREDLLKAYRKAGFKTQIYLPAKQGLVHVNSTMPTGTYTAVRYYSYGGGSWQAITDSGTTAGSFSNAPISVNIRSYLWS